MKKLIVSVVLIVGFLCLYTYLKSPGRTINTTEENTETGVEIGKDEETRMEVKTDMLEWKDTRHLTFKGVPIDGTLKRFVARMETVGFVMLSYLDKINNKVMREHAKGDL